MPVPAISFLFAENRGPADEPWGPKMVRDLGSLIQRAEADAAVQVPVDHTLSSV